MSDRIAAAASIVLALAVPATAFAQPRHNSSSPTSYEGTLPYRPIVTDPSGNVVGTDPDANIRFELRRDWGRGRN